MVDSHFFILYIEVAGGDINMAVSEDNIRMSLTLPKELNEKVDILAGYQNISKNAVIVNLVQMSIDAQIKVWAMLKDPDMLQNLIKLSAGLEPEKMEELLKIKAKMDSADPKDVKDRDNVEATMQRLSKKKK